MADAMTLVLPGLQGAQRAADFLEINPLGKVPCLQLVPGDKVCNPSQALPGT